MPGTVADIMEAGAPSVTLDASVEEVVTLFTEQDVPALHHFEQRLRQEP